MRIERNRSLFVRSKVFEDNLKEDICQTVVNVGGAHPKVQENAAVVKAQKKLMENMTALAVMPQENASNAKALVFPVGKSPLVKIHH